MIKNKKIKIAIATISLVALLIGTIGILGGLGGVSDNLDDEPAFAYKCEHLEYKNGLCVDCFSRCPHIVYKLGVCEKCSHKCHHEDHHTTLNASDGYKTQCKTCDVILRHEWERKIVQYNEEDSNFPCHRVFDVCVGNGLEGGFGCGRIYEVHAGYCVNSMSDGACTWCGRTAIEYCIAYGIHNFQDGFCKMCGTAQ